ncbi:MAG: hypothetical protein AAGA48_02715 [Myxococcota bacterium]
MLVWSLLGLVTASFAQDSTEAEPDGTPAEPWSEPPWRGSVGLGLAFVQDLGDRADPAAQIGPGLSLQLPLRFSVAPAAAIRIQPRVDGALGGGVPSEEASLCAGLDQISWQVTDARRTVAPSECGWLLAVGATIGPEVRWPTQGPVQPYLAGGVGALGTFVINRSERGELLIDDPDFTRVDGWTAAASWLTDVHLGVLVGRKTQWFAEAGYAVAWVPRARVRGSVDVLDVQREPFAYNTVRIASGIAFAW